MYERDDQSADVDDSSLDESDYFDFDDGAEAKFDIDDGAVTDTDSSAMVVTGDDGDPFVELLVFQDY